MALEGEGGVAGEELHLERRVVDDAAIAHVEAALHPCGDVHQRHLQVIAPGDNRHHLHQIGRIIAPLLRLDDGGGDGDGGVGMGVDPVRAHTKALLGMVHPHLAGGNGGVAQFLIHQLAIPRLAHAEGVHGVGLHVGHHLRRRHGDEIDILVGIDAARRQPVADPQIVGAAGIGHGHGDLLAAGLLLANDALHPGGIDVGPGGKIGLVHRDALTIDVEPGEDAHRRLAGLHAQRQEIAHRGEDMRAIDAARAAAQHEIVARCAPAGLLGQHHIGHTVFGEKPQFLGDNQRCRIGQRDEAQPCALHLGRPCGSEGLAHKQAFARNGGGNARARFQEAAAV